MEAYRLILKKRISVTAFIMIFAAAIQFTLLFDVFGIAGNEGFSDGVLMGFQSGLISGILLVFVFMTVRYMVVIRDDNKLKIQYNLENDERRKAIKEKSGGNVIIVSTIITIFAGIIAGYFNETVFYSLVACGIFQITFSAILKLYYFKKY